ncbi:hypothetical protein N7507_005870 [Penicillium longicatenatum]|nr:hypothetical protein N7507_005870 [Penicillium longicatenatum]
MILFFTGDPRSGVRPFVRDFVLLEKLVIGARGGEALHEQLHGNAHGKEFNYTDTSALSQA